MVDAIGQEIKVGDIVVRGIRSGNSGAITVGVVTGIAGDALFVNGRKCLVERTVVIDASRCDVSKLGRDPLGVLSMLHKRAAILEGLK